MIGQTIAHAHWTALDREGEDNCRLSHCASGWLLVGHARFRDSTGFSALDYVLRCDSNWHTLSVDIGGLHGDRDVRIQISHEPAGWLLNGKAQPDLELARDIDLGFTPATNLMPLRRLSRDRVGKLALRAAWLNYPERALRPLDQIYVRESESGVISYSAAQTGFSSTLTVDPSGFVTEYPGLWRGEIDHAPA